MTSLSYIIQNYNHLTTTTTTTTTPPPPISSSLLIGSPKVVVTLGDKGCLLMDREGKELHINCPTVRAIDTSGGGDAFVGSLAVYLSKGEWVVVVVVVVVDLI